VSTGTSAPSPSVNPGQDQPSGSPVANQPGPSGQPAILAVDDTYQLGADGTSVGKPGLLGNDRVPPGVLSIDMVTRPQHGTVVVASDGSFVYLPNRGYVGPDSFTYRLLSSEGPSNTATVQLTVPAPAAAGSTTDEPFSIAGSQPGGAADISVSTVNVGLGLEWVVPTLSLSVPGFLLSLIVFLQLIGAAAWLPAIKRSLSGLGVSRPNRA
jgi:hypothetical protein